MQHTKRSLHRILLPGLILTFSATVALGESRGQDASLKEVLRKAQGVMRQLNEDKTRLEAEKTALLGEKTALESRVKQLEDNIHKLENLPAALERCQAGVENLQGVRTGLEAQIGEARDNAVKLKRQQQVLSEQSRSLQADNQWLVEAVREREQWIDRCGDNNQHLLQTQRELLEKYQEKTLWKRMAELEPLTGIGAVQTENAAESYRYQLHRLQVTPYTPTPNTPRPVVSPTGNGGEP
jgi:chromosome segregation ATPase